jgi:hypothetical protein
MATPPSIRQITRETLGDVPAWLDKVLLPLNTFMQQVTDALSGNLSGQNFTQGWVRIAVAEGQALPAPFIVPGLKGRAPAGVTMEGFTVQSGSVTTTPSVAWEVSSALSAAGASVPAVRLTSVYGLDSAARVTLTLLVKAE